MLATARDLKAATELTKLAEGKDVQLFEADLTSEESLKVSTPDQGFSTRLGVSNRTSSSLTRSLTA